uniref:Putative phosphoglycerate kinase (Fragments) n=1 Tax=Pinus strobus TaxID=3348 RepID=PGK_PINST|nr:RecName: Full=Putative phosphoglycerate kinase; AltName: Full=PS15 [Pinus strobus]
FAVGTESIAKTFSEALDTTKISDVLSK